MFLFVSNTNNTVCLILVDRRENMIITKILEKSSEQSPLVNYAHRKYNNVI